MKRYSLYSQKVQKFTNQIQHTQLLSPANRRQARQDIKANYQSFISQLKNPDGLKFNTIRSSNLNALQMIQSKWTRIAGKRMLKHYRIQISSLQKSTQVKRLPLPLASQLTPRLQKIQASLPTDIELQNTFKSLSKVKEDTDFKLSQLQRALTVRTEQTKTFKNFGEQLKSLFKRQSFLRSAERQQWIAILQLKMTRSFQKWPLTGSFSLTNVERPLIIDIIQNTNQLILQRYGHSNTLTTLIQEISNKEIAFVNQNISLLTLFQNYFMRIQQILNQTRNLKDSGSRPDLLNNYRTKINESDLSTDDRNYLRLLLSIMANRSLSTIQIKKAFEQDVHHLQLMTLQRQYFALQMGVKLSSLAPKDQRQLLTRIKKWDSNDNLATAKIDLKQIQLRTINVMRFHATKDFLNELTPLEINVKDPISFAEQRQHLAAYLDHQLKTADSSLSVDLAVQQTYLNLWRLMNVKKQLPSLKHEALSFPKGQIKKIDHYLDADVLESLINQILHLILFKLAKQEFIQICKTQTRSELKQVLIKAHRQNEVFVRQHLRAFRKLTPKVLQQFMSRYQLLWHAASIKFPSSWQATAEERMNHATNLTGFESQLLRNEQFLNNWTARHLSKLLYDQGTAQLILNQQARHLQDRIDQTTFKNQIARSVITSSCRLLQDQSSATNDHYQTGRQKLILLERVFYQTQIDEQVAVMKKDLNYLTPDTSTKVIHQIDSQLQQLKVELLTKLKQSNQSSLADVTQAGIYSMHWILFHGLANDPIKKSILNHLSMNKQLINKAVQNYVPAKKQSRTKKSNRKFLQNAKRSILRPMSKAQAQHWVKTMNRQVRLRVLKMARKDYLRGYEKAFENYEKRLRSQKLMSTAELRQTDNQFNETYHRDIHELSKAKNIQILQRKYKKALDRLSNLQNNYRRSEQARKQWVQKYDLQVHHYQDRIKHLSYTPKADQQRAFQLLQNINNQFRSQISHARNDKKDQRTYAYYTKIIKQVVNRIVSANVMVSAFHRADSYIQSSKLSPKAKQKMLKRIHQAILRGSQSSTDKKTNKNKTGKDTKEKIKK